MSYLDHNGVLIEPFRLDWCGNDIFTEAIRLHATILSFYLRISKGRNNLRYGFRIYLQKHFIWENISGGNSCNIVLYQSSVIVSKENSHRAYPIMFLLLFQEPRTIHHYWWWRTAGHHITTQCRNQSSYSRQRSTLEN